MALWGRKKTSSNMPVWPLALLGAVIVIAIGLRVYEMFHPRDPRVQIPSATYSQVMQELEAQRALQEAAQQEQGAEEEDVQVPQDEEVEGAPEVEEEIPALPIELPTEFNLAVPFTSQAPTGEWDTLHEDTCEEASWLMVREYYAGNTLERLDPAVVDPELIAMVDSQTKQGLEPSVTANELVTWMESYDGTLAEIIENPTIDQMKRILVEQGRPIIVPMAGRELGNPYFSGEGPVYHMLVIRGYTAEGFITNEPGTRMGENYFYSYDVVMEAMGDWEGKDPANGAKRIIVVHP